MINNILITGGAGYAGSHLVRLLLQSGCKVIIFDKLNFGGESLLGIWHHPNFKFILGDITQPDFITKIFDENKIDAVVHLAAIVGDPACAKQPELARRVNKDASINLLEIAKENDVQRFVFASTCSNYGKMSNPNSFVSEESALAPVSLYAELKVAVENVILKELKKDSSFCPTALRFSTIYGVSPRMRFDLTVNEFTKDLVLGRELEIFGEKFWRPYCHVYDFARAIKTVLESEKSKVSHNVFNVGDTNENYQKQMIVGEINRFVPNIKVKYIYKNEDPRDYKVSFEKIKTELGFKVSKKLPDGIREVKYCIEKKLIVNPDDVRYKNV